MRTSHFCEMDLSLSDGNRPVSSILSLPQFPVPTVNPHPWLLMAESKTKAEQVNAARGSELQTGLLFTSELGALGLGSYCPLTCRIWGVDAHRGMKIK